MLKKNFKELPGNIWTKLIMLLCLEMHLLTFLTKDGKDIPQIG